uniref:Uncharacterized protein n=1 Tax=Neogobius melanostomus TaxID=47308 RepID=A0A8C6T409_9GOBI
MPNPVLLLLLLWIVQCGGCGSDLEGVRNIKTTIDMNLDTSVLHLKLILVLSCLQCCVFPAAVVLLDSWHVLLRNLWDEHLNRSLVHCSICFYLKTEKMIKATESLTDMNLLSAHSSPPEELLRLTSELLSRWIEVACNDSLKSCSLPTLPPNVEKKNNPLSLPPPVERKDYDHSRARLLTTRAIDAWEDLEQADSLIDTTQLPSSGGRLSVPDSVSLCSPLLFRLYWWLLS